MAMGTSCELSASLRENPALNNLRKSDVKTSSTSLQSTSCSANVFLLGLVVEEVKMGQPGGSCADEQGRSGEQPNSMIDSKVP